MSYARFSDCDVYVFGTDDGFECQCCHLLPSTRPENLMGYESFRCATRAEMVGHLLTHVAKGDDTDDAIDCLREEMRNSPPPVSVVAIDRDPLMEAGHA